MTTAYQARLRAFEDGAKHASRFGARPSASRLLRSFRRALIWKRTLAEIHAAAPQSVLLHAGHAKIVEFWMLVPIGLDHAAYACLRTMYDSFQAFGYYLHHPAEWESVCRGNSDWMMRSELVNYYRDYAPHFRTFDQQFGYRALSAENYWKLSSFVHSIPVTGLPSPHPLDGKPVSPGKLDALVAMAEAVDEDLNLLFIALFHRHMVAMGSSDYRTVAQGVSRPKFTEAGIHLPG